MSEAAAPDKAAAAAPAGSKGPKGPLGPMILALVNTIAALGMMGMAVYTKVLFKRPPITEESERVRLAAKKDIPPPPTTPGVVMFEPFTVNIQAQPLQPRPADGTPSQIQGKFHYANVGFALEIRDIKQQALLDELRPVIMDKMLSLLGRKQFHELVTVQGRYVLREQILNITNQLAKSQLVTNVFFTHFMVQ